MRKLLPILFLLMVTTAQAQFTINGADDYLKKKSELAEKQRIQDSIILAQKEYSEMMANDIRYRIKWVNMVTYRQSIGLIQNGFNLSYYGYLLPRKTSEWIYPISFRLSGSESYNEGSLKPGYKDWKERLTDLGVSGFKEIKNNFYLSLGGHVPFGWEVYRYDTEPSTVRRHVHLLIGASAEERLMYISPSKVGLTMSVGFYQQLINSKLYNLEAGFSFEVGVKF